MDKHVDIPVFVEVVKREYASCSFVYRKNFAPASFEVVKMDVDFTNVQADAASWAC